MVSVSGAPLPARSGRAGSARHRDACRVIGEGVEVLDRYLAHRFDHRLRVAGPLARLEAAQALAQILLALPADARHLLAAAQVVAVAEHALVLARKLARLGHSRGVGRRRGARGRQRRQRVDDRREAAQVVVLHRLRDRRHRLVAAPAFAKQEQLRDGVEAVLAGERRRPGKLAATVGAVARGAERGEALRVRACPRRRRRCRGRGRRGRTRPARLRRPRCGRLGAGRAARLRGRAAREHGRGRADREGRAPPRHHAPAAVVMRGDHALTCRS